MTEELAKAIGEFGFPIIAALGLGYFVYYIWKWVTLSIKPIILLLFNSVFKKC